MLKLTAATVLGLLATLVLLTGCSSSRSEMPTPEPMAETSLTPSETPAPDSFERWQTMSVTGIVESVDLDSRVASIRGPGGNVFSFVVDEQVRRLDEVAPGDEVVVEYFVSVAGEVRAPTPEEEATPLVVLEAEGRAPPGTSPAGGALNVIQAVVTVEGIDRPTQTVTVKGPLGNYVIIDVADPSWFERLRIGDTAVVTYTESLAISLKKVGM